MIAEDMDSSFSMTLASIGGMPVTVAKHGREVDAAGDGRRLLSLRFDEAGQGLELIDASDDLHVGGRALSAVAEALFNWRPHSVGLDLDLGPAPTNAVTALARHALRNGLLQEEARRRLSIRPELLMQRRDNWLADPDVAPNPLDYAMSEGRRHPRRPPKPVGRLYARHIPWLAKAISFRTLTLDDLPLFHRWMNDPRVDAFWNEGGTLDAHRGYLSERLADPHNLPLIGSFDATPFAYFEIYWAKENRIAPFYEADDYDRGWHVAVGEDAFLGRPFISAWLPSLMHLMFLDDPRTRQIVGEPAVAHVQQIRNLEVSGFAKLKTFDFSHKRAALMVLLRERFFADRLWLPALPTRTKAAQ